MAAKYFTQATFTFLKDLKANNNREWFQDNKHRYEDHLKDPSVQFISDFGAHLKKIIYGNSSRQTTTSLKSMHPINLK